MEIRKATTDDINVIRDLAYVTWPVAYAEILSREQLAFMLEKFYSDQALEERFALGHEFLIAEDGLGALGFASFDCTGENSHLHKLYVLPSAQGKKLGELLLKKVIFHSRENGCQRLTLNVNRFNKARFFYEKQGFSIDREEDIAIGNGYLMEDYIMGKSI